MSKIAALPLLQEGRWGDRTSSTNPPSMYHYIFGNKSIAQGKIAELPLYLPGVGNLAVGSGLLKPE